jgi:hypothetical protein
VVEQAQIWDEIPGSAHFDEKLDRIESLLKRLVDNDVLSASRAALSTTSSESMVNQGSPSENYATRIAESAKSKEITLNASFSNNVICDLLHFLICLLTLIFTGKTSRWSRSTT